MGFGDWLSRLFGGKAYDPPASSRGTPSRASSSGYGSSARASPPSKAESAGLEAAMAKRRVNGFRRRKTGKPASAYRMRQYERLERTLLLQVGKFPWSQAEAREVLARAGFRPNEAEAYLSSDGARKLLE